MKDKIELIYQMFIGEVKLSRRNLNLRKINDEEIELLIKLEIIKPFGENIFELIDYKGLYQYGIKLLENRQCAYAFLCFSKAYEINSCDRDICIQYIVELIRKNNYEKALDVYKKMVLNSNEDDAKENNLYLCLFSRLMFLNDELVNKVKYLSYSDVLLNESKENQVDNDIRKSIMQSKYTYACSLINNKIRKNSEYVVSDMLVKTLLGRIIDKDKKDKLDMVNYTKEEKYDLIIKMLEDISKQKNLNRIENSILMLCEVIVKGINDKKIEYTDFSGVNDTYNVYDAIIVKDYRLAMELNVNFLEYKNEDCNEDILHILLVKINKLVDELKDYIKENNACDIILEEQEDNNFENNNIVEPEIDMDKVIKDIEEWAYYLKDLKIGIDKAIKKTGLFNKYALLVKLVLARDYYLNGDYVNGDRYLLEVENKLILDKEVEIYLEEVKSIRNSTFIDRGNARKLVK